MSTSRRTRSTVTVVQTTLPGYRTPFFEELSRVLGSRLALFSGDEDWYPDVRHVNEVPHRRAHNVFLARRRLLWQRGTLKPLLAAEVAVLDLNPRILSAWVAVLGRRLTGRRTVLWGHAWPRRGEGSWTDRVRSAMRRLAGAVVVYTETEARALRAHTRGIEITAAPNALYPRDVLGAAVAQEPPTSLLFVGRLSPSKRVGVLIDAFLLAEDTLPADVRLVIVGEGSERAALERRAAGSGRVDFEGHVSSVDALRELHARAIASVSAGEVGLSIVQSLGFGVPMVVARGEDHGPEIEAALEGENSVYFQPTDATALAAAMSAVVRDREHWLGRRQAIADWTGDRYSIEVMVDSFLAGLEIEPSLQRDARSRSATSGEQEGSAP